MEQVITAERLPIKMWLKDIENGASEQARNLANFPFAFKHIALMPDCHQGFGMPIGGILATQEVIVPNAVGVDIGCGMCATRSSIKTFDTDTMKSVIGTIRTRIPVGFDHHKMAQDKNWMPSQKHSVNYPVVDQEFQSALHQVGTLGGGNHFIEIQKDAEDQIWVMIHSGSRNIGFTVASYYNKLAISLNEKWKSPVPKKWQLAYLPIDSKEGREYLAEMEYCVEFAYSNRKLMLKRVQEVMADYIRDIEFGEPINIAHNYARLEKHFNREVYVHRKGATSARKGETGIIPGSMGAKSYIVEGLGNPESFQSCSHGAGRSLGRLEACRVLNAAEQDKLMKGIVYGRWGTIKIKGRKYVNLEEAPGAYKNISEVMALQKDLVAIRHELTPLAVIKG